MTRIRAGRARRGPSDPRAWRAPVRGVSSAFGDRSNLEKSPERCSLHPFAEGRATANPSKGGFASGVSTRYSHQSAHDRPVACSETDDRDRYPKGRSRHDASRVGSYRVRFRVVAAPAVVAGSAKRTDRPLAEEPGRGGLRSRAQVVRRTARRSRLPSRPFPKRAALAGAVRSGSCPGSSP